MQVTLNVFDTEPSQTDTEEWFYDNN